jgi:hypothetical protein
LKAGSRTLGATVLEEGGNSRAFVLLDVETGSVVGYSVVDGSYMNEPNVHGHSHKDGLSKETAWKLVIPILQYYGLPTSPEKDALVMVDRYSPENPDDLYGAMWTLHKEFSYQGIECPDKGIWVELSAFSGHIWQVIYHPIVRPEGQPSESLSKLKAISVAQDWLSARPYFSGKKANVNAAGEGSVTLAVMQPNDRFLESDKRNSKEDYVKAFWCWKVPFAFEEHGHHFSANAFVRLDNGAVIACY